jgi:hypothetical protein
LGKVQTPGGVMTKYLSVGTSLTSAQRAEAAEARQQLASALEPRPDPEARAMFFVGLFARPGGQMDAKESAQRTMNYREATDDLPVWALQLARKRWNRGEVTPAENGGRAPNFDFAPSPASLRLVALNITAPYRHQLREIDELLAAKPLEEILGQAGRKSQKVIDGFAQLSDKLGAAPDLHRRPKAEPIDVEAIKRQANPTADTEAEQV